MLREAHWQGTYPVEGDSAVAELLFGGEIIGDLRLVEGEVRAAFYPATGGLREFRYEELVSTLQAAHEWLTSADIAKPS